MATRERETLERGTLELGTHADVGHAAVLREAALAALDAADALRIDASRLDRVDTAGLQLLVAIVREADRRGLHVTWVAPPAQLVEAADALGLATPLQVRQFTGELHGSNPCSR